MRVVFLCNTVYQIVVATQLRYTIYKDSEADIVISNHMNGGAEIASRLKCLSSFWNEVYYYESFDLARRKNEYAVKGKFSNQLFLYIGYNKVECMPLLQKKYDVFIFSNPDISSDFLYRNLAKINKNIVCYIFEDGFSTYSIAELDFKACIESPFYKMCSLLMQRTLFSNIKGVFVFQPELMQWDKYPAFKIPPIDKKNKEFIHILNTTFQYEQLKDTYDKQVLFFEESYFKEGVDIGDVELVESIAKLVGKDNIMIKIHPRNGINRFKEMGYKTNINTAIPWEIIALNMNVEDRILITVASGAAIMPILLFASQSRGILLINMLNKNVVLPYELSIYHKFILEKILPKYNDYLFAPTTSKELLSLIMN